MEKAKERWGGRGSHREGVRDGERAGWGGGERVAHTSKHIHSHITGDT